MRSLAEALPGLALVLGLPGLSALLVARVRVSVVEAVALVPSLSLGLVWLLAEVSEVLGLPLAPVGLVLLLVGLALGASVRWRRARAPYEVDLEAVPAAPTTPTVERTGRGVRLVGARSPAAVLALGLLVVAVLLGLATWVWGIKDHPTTPPNYDSSQHGFMVERIARSGETSAAEVVVSDPRGRSKAADYYPLALHAALALAERSTGADPAALLNGAMIVFAAVVLPCGLYALGRRIVPGEPLVGGFSALLAVLLTIFPYKPAAWGGITLIVATSALPAIAVLVDRTVGAWWSWPGAVLSAFGTMAILAVHNSELPMLGILVLLLLVERSVQAPSWVMLRDGILRLVVIGAGALLLFLPTLPSFLRGVSERSSFRDTDLLPVDALLGPMLSLGAFVPGPQRWLALLALIGAGVMLWRHQLVWVVGTLIVLWLTLLAGTSNGALAGALTFAWYRQPERVMYFVVAFVPVLAAVALAAACRSMASRLARTGTRAFVRASSAVVIVVVVTLALIGGADSARANRAMLRDAYIGYGPVGVDEVAAFEWLGRYAPGDGLVLTDLNADGSLWMYSFGGASPLFAAYPKDDGRYQGRSFDERSYLHDRILELGRNERLDRLLRKYRVRYVYFGEETFRGSAHSFTLSQLRALPGLREVWQRGRAHVFEIVDS